LWRGLGTGVARGAGRCSASQVPGGGGAVAPRQLPARAFARGQCAVACGGAVRAGGVGGCVFVMLVWAVRRLAGQFGWVWPEAGRRRGRAAVARSGGRRGAWRVPGPWALSGWGCGGSACDRVRGWGVCGGARGRRSVWMLRCGRATGEGCVGRRLRGGGRWAGRSESAGLAGRARPGFRRSRALLVRNRRRRPCAPSASDLWGGRWWGGRGRIPRARRRKGAPGRRGVAPRSAAGWAARAAPGLCARGRARGGIACVSVRGLGAGCCPRPVWRVGRRVPWAELRESRGVPVGAAAVRGPSSRAWWTASRVFVACVFHPSRPLRRCEALGCECALWG